MQVVGRIGIGPNVVLEGVICDVRARPRGGEE